MKEKELIDLGFNKVVVPVEESGDFEFVYFTYDFLGGLSLISNADNEVVDGEYEIEMFDNDAYSFTNTKDISELIDLLKRCEK